MDQMKKIAHFLASSVAPVLRQMDELQKKLATAEQRLAEYNEAERYAKIASFLDGKGGFAGKSLEERVRSLRKLAEEGADLNALETAAKMMTPDGNIGKVAEAVDSDNSGLSGFVRAVMTF